MKRNYNYFMSEEKKGLNIELTEQVAEGIYSNLAIINTLRLNLC